MTFDEFFLKKRIDLKQFALADPLLYEEFRKHFEVMGEKSFDHTKKFWFNKLRRLYVPELVVKVAKVAEEDKIASQAEVLSSPVIEQQTMPVEKKSDPVSTASVAGAVKAGFRPRSITSAQSKAAEPSPENVTPAADPVSPEPAPSTQQARPGFRPRNVKTVEKTPKDESLEELKSQDGDLAETKTPGEEAKPSVKPGFKPRNIKAVQQAEEKEHPTSINAGGNTTNNESVAPAGEMEKPEATVVKPGFKPRNVKAVQQQSETPATQDDTTGEASEDKAGSDAEAITPNPAPKLGFKPRNVKAVQPQSETPTTQNDTTGEASKDKAVSDAEATKPNPAPKLGFKPRNVKAVQQQSETPTTQDDTTGEASKDKTVSDAEATKPNPAPKLGFKPRNVKVVRPPVQEADSEDVQQVSNNADHNSLEKESDPNDVPAAKPAFKLRNVKSNKTDDSNNR